MPTHQEQGRFQGPPPPPTHCPGPACQRTCGRVWPPSGREAGRGGGRSDTSARGRGSRPLQQGGFICGGASYRPQLSLPSRSHLQPPSYGPVLSPMNKAHGAVNKLPSVNQLVGQPPLHGSAAGPNLGPMGEWRGQGGWDGWGDPKGGPGSRHPQLRPMRGSRWLLPPAAPAQEQEARPRTVSSVHSRSWGGPSIKSLPRTAWDARPGPL